MAKDCPASIQETPTRFADATLRLEHLGADDTFLLGDHSYDNFLEGVQDDVSFAVPHFSARMQPRPQLVVRKTPLATPRHSPVKGAATSSA